MILSMIYLILTELIYVLEKILMNMILNIRELMDWEKLTYLTNEIK